MGIITSVKRALPVGSWNSRAKSLSSRLSGTIVRSMAPSASLVRGEEAKWSVSTNTHQSPLRAATAFLSCCAAGHQSVEC
eukprot:1174253-Prorocentrum_minimum.AAC.1